MTATTEKLCARCGVRPRVLRKSGKYDSYCTECRRAYFRAYRGLPVDTSPAPAPEPKPRYRVCIICGTCAPIDAFVDQLCICRACSPDPDTPHWLETFRPVDEIIDDGADDDDTYVELDAINLMSAQSKSRRLTHDEVIALMDRIHAGDHAAFAIMVQRNLGLVWKFATRIRAGDPDLVQAGTLGLMKAIRRYDYTTGNQFSTYAVWWIRQSISRWESQNKVIHIPIHIQDKVRHARTRIHITGIEATPAHIAQESGQSHYVVAQVINADAPLSLDLTVPGKRGGEVSLDDFVMDENAPDPAAVVEINDTVRLVLDRLAAFPQRDREMFLLRSVEDWPLHEIAARFGLSRERVRQIVARVTSYMRACAEGITHAAS